MDLFVTQLENEVASFANARGLSLDKVFKDAELDRPNFNKAKHGKVTLEWTAFDRLRAHTKAQSHDNLEEGYRAYRDQRQALSRKGGPSDRHLSKITSLPIGSLEQLAEDFDLTLDAQFDYPSFKVFVDQTLNTARLQGHMASARRCFFVIVGTSNQIKFVSEADRLYGLSYVAHIGRYAGYLAGDAVFASAAQSLAYRLYSEDRTDPVLRANLAHIAAFRGLIRGSDDYDLSINQRRLLLLNKIVPDVASIQKAARAEPTIRAMMEFILRSDLARTEARTLSPTEVVEQQKRYLDNATRHDQMGTEQIMISERRVAEAELYRGSAEMAAELLGNMLARMSCLSHDIPDWLIGSTHRMRAEALTKLSIQAANPFELLSVASRHCASALHHFGQAQGVVFMRETQAMKRHIDNLLR